MRRIGPISHSEELSLVEHLSELRTRLIVLIVCFVAAFGLGFWQDDWLIEVANRPLPLGLEPATFGVAEAFTSTFRVVSYAALLAIFPVLIYQLYAFILPGLKPSERTTALPMLLMAPVLFLAGVVFAYFAVVPRAAEFLLAFNADSFNIQVRAKEYYNFLAVTLLWMGLLFQIPVGVLIGTELGIVTSKQLRDNWRYALLIIAVVAMLLPGADPFSMLLMMLPMIVLYVGSIVLVEVIARRAAKRQAAIG